MSGIFDVVFKEQSKQVPNPNCQCTTQRESRFIGYLQLIN